MNAPQPEIAKEWLRRARSDLKLGKAALRTRGVLSEDACFHAQQCTEKALKALLISLGQPFPHTHAIEVLLDLLKTHGFDIPNSVDKAFELSQYAVQTRYPGEWEPVTKREATGTLTRAALVLAWVESQLR
ncbi:MAG: HEPN domain-containing protein [Anaerolineales bacterium]|nr:HEPN domain-containing protein [Anaerolineales bacterium]